MLKSNYFKIKIIVNQMIISYPACINNDIGILHILEMFFFQVILYYKKVD